MQSREVGAKSRGINKVSPMQGHHSGSYTRVVTWAERCRSGLGGVEGVRGASVCIRSNFQIDALFENCIGSVMRLLEGVVWVCEHAVGEEAVERECV